MEPPSTRLFFRRQSSCPPGILRRRHNHFLLGTKASQKLTGNRSCYKARFTVSLIAGLCRFGPPFLILVNILFKSGVVRLDVGYMVMRRTVGLRGACFLSVPVPAVHLNIVRYPLVGRSLIGVRCTSAIFDLVFLAAWISIPTTL